MVKFNGHMSPGAPKECRFTSTKSVNGGPKVAHCCWCGKADPEGAR